MDDLTVEVADSIRASIDSEAVARRAIRATIQHIIEQVDLLVAAGDPSIPVDPWLATLQQVRVMLIGELEEAVGGPGEASPLF